VLDVIGRTAVIASVVRELDRPDRQRDEETAHPVAPDIRTIGVVAVPVIVVTPSVPTLHVAPVAAVPAVVPSGVTASLGMPMVVMAFDASRPFARFVCARRR